MTTPYRREWRTAGCGLTLLFALAAAVCLSGPLTAVLYTIFGHQHLVLLATISTIVTTLGLRWLYKLATTRAVPICPHCGVATNPQFRICRACVRVK